jgi:hypothetical protein
MKPPTWIKTLDGYSMGPWRIRGPLSLGGPGRLYWIYYGTGISRDRYTPTNSRENAVSFDSLKKAKRFVENKMKGE